MARPAEHYVHADFVVVPGRVIAYLERAARLDDFRIQHRGQDPQVDEVLRAMHIAALRWRTAVTAAAAPAPSSVDTTAHTTPAQPDGESSYGLTTGQAAARLGVGAEAVRKAIREGRLPAEQHDGRWRITPEVIEHYRAARAA
ncbi:helix-turn-helix domain-containing protein [Curtobacterium citreum]|uniref:helix-turn-helix domain-containing protein n=1 Tax=Curtobacterium citreum TaxID=2036 RepID=UPI0007362420|nr:helix-turn-helix domain-containing protein [Curtobacterium citreum]KTR11068.1 hypothetical protein NS330_12970 [Curtobacterium citreum]